MKLSTLVALGAAILSLGSPSAASARECKLRGVSIQPGVPAPEVHAHSADGSTSVGIIKLRSFLNHEYDEVEVDGPKLVFTLTAEPPGAGDPAANLIGACELPANATSMILVFVPKEAGKPVCDVLVVPDDAKSFPPGSIHVANHTSLPVRIELEDEKFDFKPGETQVIEDPPVGAKPAAGMMAYCHRDGKWQKFSSGVWPNPGTKRVLQILTENPVSKQVMIRSVRDVAEP